MKKLIYLSSLLFAFLVSCSDDDNDSVDLDDSVIIEDSKPTAVIPSQGFFIANEDWFGHDNGSVNYFKNDGSITYRAYRAVNNDESFGVTTQFATIYGGNAYFVSKQGNRLVVADAKTLKKKAALVEIGGDGRSFLGVNPNLGYIATSKGITLFNIKDMTAGDAIADISGQVGNMYLAGGRAFAVVQSKGVYVISTATNTVEKLIAGSYNCMTQSKDGNLWIGAGAKLIQLNPYTLETTEIALTGTTIAGSWGAWNAGGLCASTQHNVIYWASGGSMFGGAKAITKYDIDKKALDAAFYTLGKDSEGVQLEFYGASVRVDPISDKLVLTVKRSGWGTSGSYNWVQILSANAALEKNIVVKGDNGTGSAWAGNPTVDGNYYWFPAMPFFEDVNAPEILINQIILKPNERKAIYLNDKIVDADNTSASIIKSIAYENNELSKYELKGDSLIIISSQVAGKAKLKIHANSNGKVVEKEIRIDIRK